MGYGHEFLFLFSLNLVTAGTFHCWEVERDVEYLCSLNCGTFKALLRCAEDKHCLLTFSAEWFSAAAPMCIKDPQ